MGSCCCWHTVTVCFSSSKCVHASFLVSKLLPQLSASNLVLALFLWQPSGDLSPAMSLGPLDWVPATLTMHAWHCSAFSLQPLDFSPGQARFPYTSPSFWSVPTAGAFQKTVHLTLRSQSLQIQSAHFYPGKNPFLKKCLFYSYVHTMSGSFLPPSLTPSLTPPSLYPPIPLPW
jgi:hypothetical protein